MIKLTPQLAKLPNSELAKKFGVSQQAIIYARRRAAKLCRVCASPANGERLCESCRTKERDNARTRNGYRPWVPGKPGRPPIERQGETAHE